MPSSIGPGQVASLELADPHRPAEDHRMDHFHALLERRRVELDHRSELDAVIDRQRRRQTIEHLAGDDQQGPGQQPCARARTPATAQEQEAADDELRIQHQSDQHECDGTADQLVLDRSRGIAVETVLQEAFAGEGLVPVRFARGERKAQQREGPRTRTERADAEDHDQGGDDPGGFGQTLERPCLRKHPDEGFLAQQQREQRQQRGEQRNGQDDATISGNHVHSCSSRRR